MKTTQKAKALVNAIRPQVDMLLVAMANAQLWREKIDAMERGVLTATYNADPKWAERGRTAPERITDPKLAYLLSEGDFADYYAECQARIKRAGWPVEKEGNCPALEAEYLQTQAEWALILAAEPFFPGVTNNKLLCGTAREGGLETRRKYLDLLIELVVNYPGYCSPLKRTA